MAPGLDANVGIESLVRESRGEKTTGPELQERLRRHVEVLSEVIGERNSAHPPGIEAARDYLRRQLRGMDHEVLEHTFRTSLRQAVNLEVIIRGSRANARALVMGAHYDSALGTPGADDNASAVAILLEVARALSQTRLKRDVRLVFYDCEEPPHFHMSEMGSQQHARQLRARGERVMGMICLESLGYFPRRPRSDCLVPWYVRLLNRVAGSRNIIIVSDLRSVFFGLRFVWSFLRSGRFPFLPAALPRRLLPVIELSDHRSYWDEGYSALMITDTAFLRNPNYHQPTDRLDTLDLERMTTLCQAISRSVARLASWPDRRAEERSERNRCPYLAPELESFTMDPDSRHRLLVTPSCDRMA